MLKHYSFLKSHRLLNKADYGFVFDSAKKISTRWFTVLYRPSLNDVSRLGLVISKKSAKKAVARNKIKRRARETFRLSQHELPNLDVVVLSKRGISEADASQLTKELCYVWKKLSQKSP